MEFTPEEQVQFEEGVFADALLSDPTFQSIIRSLQMQCAVAILESKPDELQAREHNYNLNRGLQAIEAELRSRVQTRDTLQDRIAAVEEFEDQ